MSNEYLPLDALAATLGLPRTYLRRLAENGVIPCLNVNGMLRFEATAVREALRQQASGKKDRNDDDTDS